MKNKKYTLLRRWRNVQRWFYDAFPDIDRWTTIRYAKREYGHSRAFLEDLWDDLEVNFVPGKMDFLGFEKSVGSEFFKALAGRQMDASVSYTCVEGCCNIMWDEGRDRYIAGMGPAGCPCDDVRDMSTRRAS